VWLRNVCFRPDNRHQWSSDRCPLGACHKPDIAELGLPPKLNKPELCPVVSGQPVALPTW
jgi:hypothetical protein